VADVHTALRQDVWEAPAETRPAVEGGGTEAGTAHLPVSDGDSMVREAHEAAVGESDLEARGGEGREGGVAVVIGLTVDVPGDGPGLGSAVRQHSGVAPGVFEAGAVEGGKGCDRDTEGGTGGPPGRAVRGAAPTRHKRVDVGVRLEVPAPGGQDSGAPRQVRPHATCVGGQPFEGRSRRVEQGLVGGALRRAEAGAERCRNREGAEAVWPRQLFLKVRCKPLRGCMLLPRRAMTIATGMVHAVVAPTRVALREAVAVGAAVALWESAEDLAVCGGERGITCKVCWRKSREDSAEGGHDRSLPS
jgi:hypothetical protein